MVRTERSDATPRLHANERQPVLPFTAAYRTMNQLDLERETSNPMQMELLPPVQPDLFVDNPMPGEGPVDPTIRQ